RKSQARREHQRHPDLAHEVRERADVVLVPVGEDHRTHHLLTLAEVREIRKDEIDAEVLVTREREPGVDDDDRSVRLVDGHVLADLAETAERNDAAYPHRR